MIVLEGCTYASILKQATSLLVSRGHQVAPRGLLTRELQQVAMTLTDPTQRHPRLRGRNANIFALIAETIWVLSGRDDLRFIKAYLPRMAGFSDDDRVLSGGYGPRIRSWQGIDQLRAVVETLNCDPNSRRAVVALFDPVRDHDQTKKDIPCCSVLHFTVEDGHLHLTVYSRSMDIMWGSAINFFEWTILQEAVTLWLNVQIGHYSHFVGSLHIYEEFIGRARGFEREDEDEALPVTPFDIAFDALDDACSAYFSAESSFREGLLDRPAPTNSLWMTEAIELTRAFWTAKLSNDYRTAERMVKSLPVSEWSVMAMEQIAFMERAYAKSLDSRAPHA